MTAKPLELPPLPAGDVMSEEGWRVSHSDDALQAYGAACARAALEAAAVVCARRYMGDNNREDMEARRCAAAIREMIQP